MNDGGKRRKVGGSSSTKLPPPPTAVLDLLQLSVADCDARDAFAPGEQRRYAPQLLVRGAEALLRVSRWLPLPFGLEAASSAASLGKGAAAAAAAQQRSSDDSFKVRLLLPDEVGAKLAELEAQCEVRLRALPGCEELRWTPSLREDRSGALSLNVKFVLGGSFEAPTQFKLRVRDEFRKGEGGAFFRAEVAGRMHYRGGHAQLVLRPRYYVMGDNGTAGLYFTATHAALWSSREEVAAALDVDAVFPDRSLLEAPPLDD
jgi:hypothetical protein